MSTVCPRCQGFKTHENPAPTWNWDEHVFCRVCSGTGVYVSRARAGLKAPTIVGQALERLSPFPNGWLTESTPTGRSLLAAFGRSQVGHTAGGVVKFDKTESGWAPDREFVMPKGRVSFDYFKRPPLPDAWGTPDVRVGTPREIVMADLENQRKLSAAATSAAFYAALVVEQGTQAHQEAEDWLNDVAVRIGEVDFTNAQVADWKKRLAECGVTISVHENRINVDLESRTGEAPGFLSYSAIEKWTAMMEIESLPEDNKPDPRPKKGAGYHGDWKQGQHRRGRR